MKEIFFEQRSNGDCGNQAVLFAAAMAGVTVNLFDEHVVDWSDENGTSHEAIIDSLNYLDLNPIQRIGEIDPPCIVNYLVDDESDGHYAVILSRHFVPKFGPDSKMDDLVMYDPEDGRIKIIPWLEFKKVWKSFRYPPDQWSVSFTS